jgi:hypothetical protein
MPKFDRCDELILAGLGVRKLDLQPAVENDARHVAGRLYGVGEEKQGRQGWHSESEKNTTQNLLKNKTENLVFSHSRPFIHRKQFWLLSPSVTSDLFARSGIFTARSGSVRL